MLVTIFKLLYLMVHRRGLISSMLLFFAAQLCSLRTKNLGANC